MGRFVGILIAVGVAVGLCVLTMVFVVWSRDARESIQALPADPARRLLHAGRGALVLGLVVTWPALLLQRVAVGYLPAEYHGTWWGALLVAYAASGLVYYAYQERVWAQGTKTPPPSEDE